jgi:hypothetical protein
MPKEPRTHLPISLPPVKQETDSHCGPATLQLLFSHLKADFTQGQIVKAAGIKGFIRKHGSRPKQLAKAVTVLMPGYELLFKNNASSGDLVRLVAEQQWPVAVNWQGLFYEKPEEEKQAELERLPGFNGHYSVVVDVDAAADRIVIADPYFEFADRPRQFSLSWFEKRWWDRVQDTNPKTGEITFTTTNKFLFLIAPAGTTFKNVDLRPASELSTLTF